MRINHLQFGAGYVPNVLKIIEGFAKAEVEEYFKQRLARASEIVSPRDLNVIGPNTQKELALQMAAQMSFGDAVRLVLNGHGRDVGRLLDEATPFRTATPREVRETLRGFLRIAIPEGSLKRASANEAGRKAAFIQEMLNTLLLSPDTERLLMPAEKHLAAQRQARRAFEGSAAEEAHTQNEQLSRFTKNGFIDLEELAISRLRLLQSKGTSLLFCCPTSPIPVALAHLNTVPTSMLMETLLSSDRQRETYFPSVYEGGSPYHPCHMAILTENDLIDPRVGKPIVFGDPNKLQSFIKAAIAAGQDVFAIHLGTTKDTIDNTALKRITEYYLTPRALFASAARGLGSHYIPRELGLERAETTCSGIATVLIPTLGQSLGTLTTPRAVIEQIRKIHGLKPNENLEVEPVLDYGRTTGAVVERLIPTAKLNETVLKLQRSILMGKITAHLGEQSSH